MSAAPVAPTGTSYRSLPTSLRVLNVLFLTHRLPYAPNRGDRIRAHHLLRVLRPTAKVHVVSLVHDEDEAAHAAELEPLAAATYVARVPRWRNRLRSALALGGPRPITHTMLDSTELGAAIDAATTAARPDVILAYCSGMARLVTTDRLHSYPCVLDMVDVDSEKWRALSLVSGPPMSWIYRREATVLRAFEAEAARRAEVTMVVTQREAVTLEAIAPTARIAVVPNGVDVASFRPTSAPADSAEVIFCGVMNYAPNEQAARTLAVDIWPHVRRRRPDATLAIVGSSPTRAVRHLASADTGVSVTGAVPDVRPYLWRAAVAAAPITTARGIQNKVLEAVAAGLPTVVSPQLMDSLPESVRPACVPGAGAHAFADAIVGLLNRTPSERRAMVGRANVDTLTWDQQLAPVRALLEAAAAAGPRGTRR